MKNLILSMVFMSVVLMPSKIFAQAQLLLDKYEVFEANGHAYINCVIAAGNTCKGITVYRSTDKINYERVGHVAGTCGSVISPTPYQFIDKAPIKNKLLHYKVDLGGYGSTNDISIQIVDTKEYGFQVRPNPANAQTTIYFKNEYNTAFNLNLYNLTGNVVLSQSTFANDFKLDVSGIPAGIYIFHITNGANQQKTVGRLVVQH